MKHAEFLLSRATELTRLDYTSLGLVVFGLGLGLGLHLALSGLSLGLGLIMFWSH